MKLYNTLAREKQSLKPIRDNAVRIYTCGLTVYSQPHIGNWVAYIYWDILVRTLKANSYKVERVQNITDVGHLVSDDDEGEDKMEKGAKNEGSTAWEVAEKYITIADKEAYELLKLLRPEHMPRATDYIKEQIDFVLELEQKGYTYQIANDGIYYDTARLDDYGKLAKLDVEGLEAGKRVENSKKRNKTDFALWKFSPKDKQRDMEWDSPWGKGFPGWHLECSVMAREILGDTIDIHTGGIDHIAVHHTNEIAQTEALTGKPFANIWLHNNHLKIADGKMAKSLGNIVTLRDILNKGYEINAYKVLVLSSHYQTGGNFTWEILDAAAARLDNYNSMADLVHQSFEVDDYFGDIETLHNVKTALSDNLDTPKALSLLDKLADKVNTRLVNQRQLPALKKILADLDELLGLNLSARPDISPDKKTLLAQREKARVSKDWQAADAIRDQLASNGITVRDTDYGQVWHQTKT